MDFDDTRLDDAELLRSHDAVLRELALTGARIRVESAGVQVDPDWLGARPRGIIAVGSEARLIRAVVEPHCPMPFVAWPLSGLPGWVGPLDLVIVLGSAGADQALAGTVVQATRRGAALIVAAPQDSALAQAATSSATLLIPTRTGDPLAAAVAVLGVLHTLALGPQVRPDSVAEAADLVAESCSPHRDLSDNPAKDLAMGLAEAQPLVWGASVLAARASRRIAEALRRNSRRPALAADAGDLSPVLQGSPLRDLFDDPYEAAPRTPPALIVLEDGLGDPLSRVEGQRLVELAETRGVRVCQLLAEPQKADVDSYLSLLQQGLFGASYLGIGLGSCAPAREGLWAPGS